MLNVFERHRPTMFFLIRAGGAHGSIKEATANDFENYTLAKCTDRDDGRFACGVKPCEECLALTFNQ